MKEKLLLAAASLLGFATACENKETPVMYGTPYFDYKVKGKDLHRHRRTGKRRRIYRKESDRGIYRSRPHGEGRGLVRRHLLPLGRRCGARKEGISARCAFRNRKYAPAEPDRICIASDFSHIHRIQDASRQCSNKFGIALDFHYICPGGYTRQRYQIRSGRR